jgi:hypothetical protein
MADVIYKGGMDAMKQGLLDPTPDLRVILVMTDTSVDTEEETTTMAGFTDIDEFDGVGYVEIVEATSWAYDSASDEWRLDFADAKFNVPPGTVAPATRDAQGMLLYLWVDGTDANDIPIAYTDSGGFPFNAANGDIDLTVHANGFAFLRAA